MNPQEVHMAYPRIGLALLGFIGAFLLTTFVRAEQTDKKGGAVPPFPDPGSQGQPSMNDSESTMEADPQRSDETPEKRSWVRNRHLEGSRSSHSPLEKCSEGQEAEGAIARHGESLVAASTIDDITVSR
jgi:hypothetical protein